MKQCNKCKLELELTMFNKSPINKGGLHYSCKDCQKAYDKDYKTQYNLRTKIKRAEYQKQYDLNNPGHLNKYFKKRRKIDPIFKLITNTRCLITQSFKRSCNNYNKSNHTIEMLGCTLEQFITHLQSQFVDGMTLENHGEWEIDHIIPISLALTDKDVCELNHYTNFQPLWKRDNRLKKNKI